MEELNYEKLGEQAMELWSVAEVLELLIIREYDVGFDPDLEYVLHNPIKKLREIGKPLDTISYNHRKLQQSCNNSNVDTVYD